MCLQDLRSHTQSEYGLVEVDPGVSGRGQWHGGLSLADLHVFLDPAEYIVWAIGGLTLGYRTNATFGAILHAASGLGNVLLLRINYELPANSASI
jgi:hypothetical protein